MEGPPSVRERGPRAVLRPGPPTPIPMTYILHTCRRGGQWGLPGEPNLLFSRRECVKVRRPRMGIVEEGVLWVMLQVTCK